MKCVCFEFEIILMNLVVFQENNKTTRARMDSTSELNKLVPDVWYWWVSPTFFKKIKINYRWGQASHI
jgi:hypothetical protein